MMDTVWLVCCDRHRYASLRDEIMTRHADARMAYLEDPEAFPAAVRAFSGRTGHLRVCVAHDDAETLELMVLEAASAGAAHITARTGSRDAALMARLVQEGATEVMEGPCGSGTPTRAAAGDGSLSESNQPVRAGNPSDAYDPVLSGGAAEAAPWTQANLKRYLVDLDEPDMMEAFGGGEPPAAPGGRSAAPCEPAAPLRAEAASARPPAAPPRERTAPPSRAPMLCALAGRGGCGRTTLIAALAHAMAGGGLRTAVLDLDLMFGRLWAHLGADRPRDLAQLADAAGRPLAEDDMLRTSLRIAPRLTLWGPTDLPERAELIGSLVEELLRVLRRESDVVLVDTSTYWSDSVAAAVAQADRCLIVSDARAGGAAAAQRVIELTARIGVPRTRMASVFMGDDGGEEREDAATRFEFACALSSKLRIADDGPGLADLVAFGRFMDHMEHEGAFQASVRSAAAQLARELGCPFQEPVPSAARRDPVRSRIRLPWSQLRGDAS